MRPCARFTLAFALFVLPFAAYAGPLHWTATGTSAAIEPASITYSGFANGGLSYSTGPVQAYWNIVNVTGSETPGWTTLEIGYSEPTNSTVGIILWKIDPCTGNRTAISCSGGGPVSGNVKSCFTCTFAATTFDFSTSLYEVEATLTRTALSTFPTVYSLRIY